MNGSNVSPWARSKPHGWIFVNCQASALEKKTVSPEGYTDPKRLPRTVGVSFEGGSKDAESISRLRDWAAMGI